jgi:hydrogenase maturation protease
VFDDGARRSPLTIIGLGNELLSDDGAGIRVVRELKKRLPPDHVIFEELSVGGLGLLEYISGSEKCIIIDAVMSGIHPPGTAYRFVQASECGPVSLRSSHQIDLGQVLSLAAMLGAELPRTLTVYGIEAADVTTFREACTADVSRAIPALVDAVCRDLEDVGTDSRTATGVWEVINEAVVA